MAMGIRIRIKRDKNVSGGASKLPSIQEIRNEINGSTRYEDRHTQSSKRKRGIFAKAIDQSKTVRNMEEKVEELISLAQNTLKVFTGFLIGAGTVYGARKVGEYRKKRKEAKT